ncbi:MAG: hypothetical protein WCW27_06245 [Patescibacteria group bacterium]
MIKLNKPPAEIIFIEHNLNIEQRYNRNTPSNNDVQVDLNQNLCRVTYHRDKNNNTINGKTKIYKATLAVLANNVYPCYLLDINNIPYQYEYFQIINIDKLETVKIKFGDEIIEIKTNATWTGTYSDTEYIYHHEIINHGKVKYEHDSDIDKYPGKN